MVCSGCRKPNKQVTLRCESIITSTNQQLNDGLKQLKHKAVAEVFQVPDSNTAYIHFDSVEGASVFYNTYVHRPIEINRQIFTLHPTTNKNGDVVRYGHQALSFAPVPVITATTSTMPTSTNSTAEEAADSERNVVLAVESLMPAMADVDPSQILEMHLSASYVRPVMQSLFAVASSNKVSHGSNTLSETDDATGKRHDYDVDVYEQCQ